MNKSKYILAFLSCVNIAQAAEAAKPFNGFYVGALAGWTQRDTKGSFDLNFTNHAGNHCILKYGGKKSSSALAYGVVLGYGKVLERVYLGGEMSLSHDANDKKSLYRLQKATENGVDATWIYGHSSAKCRYERSPSVGVAPRIGLIVNKSYLLFLKLGSEISHDRVVTSIYGDKFSTKRRVKVSFIPGVGVEGAISSMWKARAQYDYSLGSKISYKFDDGSGSVSYVSHSVKAGVVYQF